MVKSTNRSKFKNLVVLVAYASDGARLEEVLLTTEQYYEERTHLIDSSDYRRERSIQMVKGEIYDSKGRRTQQFENTYDGLGRLRRSRTVHEDGTVTEQVLDS